MSKRDSDSLSAPEKILAAAMRVFSVRGFDGASTDLVAAEAGVSKGLVFRYFPSKDALLRALILRWLREALDFWDNEPWDGSPADQLARILDVVVDRISSDPDGHRLYLSLLTQPGRSDAVWETVNEVKPQVIAYYARLERLFEALGSPSPGLDSKLFQFAMNGLVQTMAAEPALIGRPDILPLEAVKQRLLKRFVEIHPPPD